ncbi:TolC family protein [Aquisphaera giovannonii]|nr:TolC family protein [Aquisphaera giovannonii]
MAAAASIALAIGTPGAVVAGETLQDAWAIALGSNQGLQASQAGAASARQGVAAARAERVPTVTTTNAYTWLNTTPTFKTSLALPGASTPINFSFPFANRDFFFSSTLMNIPLYAGGRIASGIDAAGAQATAARAEETTAAQDLKLDVAQAYLNILRVEKLLLLAQTNVTSLESHQRDVSNLFREGVARRTDLLSSQVSLARARQRVIQATNDRDVARASYNRLLGRPLTDPASLQEMAIRSDAAIDRTSGGRGPEPSGERDGVRRTAAGVEDSAASKLPSALPPAPSAAPPAGDTAAAPGPAQDAEIERLTAIALSSRSELASLAGQAQAYAAQARVAESVRKPQVGLVGGFTYLENDHLTRNDYWSGSFAASWLLCDGGRSSRRAESLRLKEAQSLKQRSEAASRIALSVRSTWLSLQSARSALAVARSATRQADENLRETRDRYREQVVNNTEVLDAETLRLQTYTDYYNAFYAVLLEQFRLRRALCAL